MSEIRQRATREIYRNPWIRLREDEVEFPDGSTAQFAVVEKQDFVTVIPFSGDGFWLVEQYRYPVGARAWEFPQGGWPAGQTGSSTDLAVKELAEETGLRAGSLHQLGRLYAAYGYCNQSFDVFVATELMPGDPERERSEQDMVHRWFATEELRAMVLDGRFPDAHSVAALALFDAAPR
jgi:8-oxo-dGTP pyrophosphatase MutT (NUDIX family)